VSVVQAVATRENTCSKAKTACRISVQELTLIAAQYEVWNSIVLVQRWWHRVKGRNITIRPETIKNCHLKLMTTGSVKDAGRSGRPSMPRSEENVATVQEMFTCSPGKSTREAAHKSRLSRYTISKVLTKELDFCPWKSHHVQELTPEDCDQNGIWGADAGLAPGFPSTV
jgi:hypothetical protein